MADNTNTIAYINRKREKLSQYLAMRKSLPCLDCGGTFPPECMDFDHLPQYEKKFNASLSQASRSFREIGREMAKCEVVCANCHRVRTHVGR